MKNLSSCEAAIANSEGNLGKLQVVLAQLQSQHRSVLTSCDKISQVRSVLGVLVRRRLGLTGTFYVREQVRDMQR